MTKKHALSAKSRCRLVCAFLFACGFVLFSSFETLAAGGMGGLTLSEIDLNPIRDTEIALSPQLKFVFNKDSVFDTINDQVIPEMMPDLLPQLLGEIGGKDLGSFKLVEVIDERYSKPNDELIADIVGQVIDILMLGFLSEKKQDKIEDAITDHLKGGSLNVYITYKVKAKDMKLHFSEDDVSLKVSPSETNTLHAYLGIPNLKVTGELSVYAKVKFYLDWSKIGLGWLSRLLGGDGVSTINIELLDKDLPITARNFGAGMDAVLEFDSDTRAPRVASLEDFYLELGSLDIDDSDVRFIRQKILDYGMGQFQDSQCDEDEDLVDCVSRQIQDVVAEELPDMKAGLNDAVTGSFAKALTLENSLSENGLGVTSNIEMSSFTIENGSPFITTTWASDFTISFTEDACAAGVPDFAAGSLLASVYESGEGEADVVTPMSLPQAIIHGYVKSGGLCRLMTYDDPSTGETFEGQLMPNGPLTISPGQYEGVLMIWDNYERVKNELGLSCPYAGDREDEATVVRSAAAVRGTPALRERDTDGDENYDVLMLSSFTESALQVDMPVLFESEKTVDGHLVSLSMSATLHLAGRFEPDENNEVYFSIKQAWTDNFSGTTDFGFFEVDLPDMADQFNEELAKTYYATKVEYVTYYACRPTEENTILASTCGVRTTTSDVSCGEDCRIPAGMEVTSLSSYGFTLRTDELLANEDAVTLALTTEVEDTSTDTGCYEYSYDTDWKRNQRAEEMIAMGKIADEVRQSMIQEGMVKASEIRDQMAQYADGSYLKEIFGNVVIDENPFPDEDAHYDMSSFINNVRVYVAPEYIATKVQNREQLTESIVNNMKNWNNMQNWNHLRGY